MFLNCFAHLEQNLSVPLLLKQRSVPADAQPRLRVHGSDTSGGRNTLTPAAS